MSEMLSMLFNPPSRIAHDVNPITGDSVSTVYFPGSKTYETCVFENSGSGKSQVTDRQKTREAIMDAHRMQVDATESPVRNDD